MGLLDQGLSQIPGISSITTQKVTTPDFVQNDFKDGFIILEFENGVRRNGKGSAAGIGDVVLSGQFMPEQPFTFGGEQRIVKTWYPGNPEPTVNIMGGQETDLTIKGKFRIKKYKRVTVATRDSSGATTNTEANVRSIALEYQSLVDEMRKRGNLVQLIMGEWRRWGFIQKVEFDLKTIADISYSITFFIVGDQQPVNTRISGSYSDNVKKPNTDLITLAQTTNAAMTNFPATMPRSISEFLNQEISKVAGAIGVVTGAVNSVLTDAENITSSVYRAIGLIANARSTISSSLRRINSLATSISQIGSTLKTNAEKTVATIQTVQHIGDMRSYYASLMAQLVSLQNIIAALQKTVPQSRHLVAQGDTLQKLSNKYYNTPDKWTVIYDHNKLQSTQLVVGTVLEIPKE